MSVVLSRQRHHDRLQASPLLQAHRRSSLGGIQVGLGGAARLRLPREASAVSHTEDRLEPVGRAHHWIHEPMQALRLKRRRFHGRNHQLD